MLKSISANEPANNKSARLCADARLRFAVAFSQARAFIKDGLLTKNTVPISTRETFFDGVIGCSFLCPEIC